jgi:DNA-binding response OmpR family regulator
MKKILIVEDDTQIAAALAIRLRASGYEALTAVDPAFGAMLAVTHQPDLIISDIWMPIAQGFTFVRRLKSLGVESVPVIFITASQRDDLWETAMSLGAAAFFEKPYDTQRLLARIHEILEEPALGTRHTGLGV